jgi:hypothetical protein
MLCASLMAIGSADVRPQALTVLLLAIVALVLTGYKRGRARALWLLPVLLTLWVNLHGGYVIGLALIGLMVGGEGLAKVLGRPAAPLGPLLAVLALSTAATLVSPHGLEALAYPFSYLGSGNTSMQYIAEWQSPSFHNVLNFQQVHMLLFAASLLLGVVLGVARRPLGPTEALWALALALMALQSVRHIALYAVVVTPLLGARLGTAVSGLRRPLVTWRRPVLLAISWPLLAVSVLRMLTGSGLEQLEPGREPSSTTYPVGAVAYLRTHELQGNLFNDYDWGGYLIYHLYPGWHVFIDGRADIYGRFVDRYLTVALLRPGWRQVLAEHGVGVVLVQKESPLAVVLGDDPDWEEAYAGAVERLFVHRAPQAGALPDQIES